MRFSNLNARTRNPNGVSKILIDLLYRTNLLEEKVQQGGGGGGGLQNLQEVTDEGNETTNNIKIKQDEDNFTRYFHNKIAVTRGIASPVNNFLFPTVGSLPLYLPVSVNGEVADVNGNITIPTGGGGSTPSLQEVTDIGNETTNSIIVENNFLGKSTLTPTSLTIFDNNSRGLLLERIKIKSTSNSNPSGFQLTDDGLLLSNKAFPGDPEEYVASYLQDRIVISPQVGMPGIPRGTFVFPNLPTDTTERRLPISVNGEVADENGNITIATGGGGSTPSLQEVTDEGNITSNTITAREISLKELLYPVHLSTARLMGIAGRWTGSISIFNQAGKGTIKASDITDNRDYELPDKSGTIALLDDIPTGGGLQTLQEVTDEGNTTTNAIEILHQSANGKNTLGHQSVEINSQVGYKSTLDPEKLRFENDASRPNITTDYSYNSIKIVKSNYIGLIDDTGGELLLPDLGDPNKVETLATQEWVEEWAENSEVGYEKLHITTVEISSAQLLALDTTPVELIPAQGAGTYISIESYLYSYEYGTEDYDFNPTPNINGVAPMTGGLIGVNLGGNTSRVVRSSESHIILSENTPITLEYSGAAPTQGDGTLKLVLTYRIINI